MPWGYQVEPASRKVCDAIEPNMGQFTFCNVAKAQAMLLRLRMLNCLINGWVCNEMAAMTGSWSFFSLANAHNKPDKSCEDQELPAAESFRLATSAIATHSGAWENHRVAKAQAVYESFWAGNSGSYCRISAASASNKGGSATFSLAYDHAVWARTWGVARAPGAEACHVQASRAVRRAVA